MLPLFKLSIETAYIYSLGVLSIGLIISSIEDIIRWHVFETSGILSWQVSRLARQWTAKGLVAKILNMFLRDASFKVCIYLRLIISVLLFIFCLFNAISTVILFLSFFLLLLYMLRSPYGLSGSYQMSMVIVFSLFVGSLFGIYSKSSIFCMWFISGQLLLSYFIAGIRKALSPIWRKGDAMHDIFSTSAFGHPLIHKLIQVKGFACALSWLVIFFEMLFFMILFIDPKFFTLFFLAGFLFHLANAFFMGLNSFLFAFPATYPILFYCIQSQRLP
ncbi:MAG: hypothetical protein ACRCU0_06935 [Candidatus Rhabdochlamydia sp.]